MASLQGHGTSPSAYAAGATTRARPELPRGGQQHEPHRRGQLAPALALTLTLTLALALTLTRTASTCSGLTTSWGHLAHLCFIRLARQATPHLVGVRPRHLARWGATLAEEGGTVHRPRRHTSCRHRSLRLRSVSEARAVRVHRPRRHTSCRHPSLRLRSVSEARAASRPAYPQRRPARTAPQA